jgi:hypothetical protein
VDEAEDALSTAKLCFTNTVITTEKIVKTRTQSAKREQLTKSLPKLEGLKPPSDLKARHNTAIYPKCCVTLCLLEWQ